MLDDEWYLRVGDEPLRGPFPRAEIETALGAGQLDAGTEVCRVGSNEWLSLEAFAAHAPAAPTSGPHAFVTPVAPPRRASQPSDGAPLAAPAAGARPLAQDEFVAHTHAHAPGSPIADRAPLPDGAARPALPSASLIPPLPGAQPSAGAFAFAGISAPVAGRPAPSALDARAAQMRLRVPVRVVALLMVASLALPEVVRGSSGARFAWQSLGVDPFGVLCTPVSGLVVFGAGLFALPALVQAALWILLGLAPFVVGAVDARVGLTEGLAFGGAVWLGAALFARGSRPELRLLGLSPLGGALLLGAAYLVPISGEMPVAILADVVAGEDVLLVRGSIGRAVGVALLVPLAAFVTGVVAALAPSRPELGPRVHRGLGALPASCVALAAWSLAVVSAVSGARDFTAWFARGIGAAGAVYLAGSGFGVVLVRLTQRAPAALRG